MIHGAMFDFPGAIFDLSVKSGASLPILYLAKSQATQWCSSATFDQVKGCDSELSKAQLQQFLLRHVYGALQSATFDLVGANFDSHRWNNCYIHIHVYGAQLSYTYTYTYIYMYMKVAPSLVPIGVSFIFIKRIRPGRTQVVQDELVNHGQLLESL